MENFPYTIALLAFFLGSCCNSYNYMLVIRWFKTTKSKQSCTNCKCTKLSFLRSLNIKKCTSCGHEMDWNLDPGQMPLVRSNRMVKRDKP